MEYIYFLYNYKTSEMFANLYYILIIAMRKKFHIPHEQYILIFP